MEAYNLPVKLREWFVQRLMKQKTEEQEAMKAARKGKGGASSPSTLGRGNAPATGPYAKPR